MFFSPMINLMLMMLSAMLAMAFYTLSERKFLGYMQYRKGPNKPSIIALMVPMADATKLFLKEEKTTILMNKIHYLIAPMLMLISALFLWPLFPYLSSSFFMKFGALYFLSVTSISVYATFMAGWGSSSKWGLLGAIRGIAQTISYEVSLSLIMISFIVHMSTMNITNMAQNYYSWTMLMLIPLFISWVISILAETHRAPFDFAEGESELVSGFNIEYSSTVFALIFMAEYMNILFMSLITISITMSNTNTMELMMKTTMLSLIFIWTRGSLPRLRYDSLMDSLWKKILPLSLVFIMMTTTLMKMLN